MCEYINEIPACVSTINTVTSLSKKLHGFMLKVHIHYDSKHNKVQKPHHTNSIITYAEYITGTSVPEILHRLQRVTFFHLFINLKPEI
jgi:hypothetical protein